MSFPQFVIRAQKADGLTAFIRRACLWAEMKPGREIGYDVAYKGFTIARIFFAHKGALVKPFAAAQSFPEISDLDLVELALRVGKYRETAPAALRKRNEITEAFGGTALSRMQGATTMV